jgi:pentapeptide MXKDX repeat protein
MLTLEFASNVTIFSSNVTNYFDHIPIVIRKEFEKVDRIKVDLMKVDLMKVGLMKVDLMKVDLMKVDLMQVDLVKVD